MHVDSDLCLIGVESVAAAITLVSVLLLAVPVSAAQEGVPVPSDSNVSARVTRLWRSFPRVDVAGEVSLAWPSSLAMDSKGRLFIADLGPQGGVGPGRIYVLNRDFQVEVVVGNTEDCTVRIPQITYPLDIALDSHDRLYVADLDLSRDEQAVEILGPDLSYLGSVPIPDGGPSCVAVDSKGRLLVGNFRALGESQILVYATNKSDPTGGSMILQTRFQICPPGENCDNLHGWHNDISVGPDGTIVITEAEEGPGVGLFRVVVLDKDFRWLFSFKVPGQDPGTYLPVHSTVVDPSGVFVVASLGQVAFFFPNGTYAGRIGRQGAETGEFSRGFGLLLVTDRGRLLVPETGNARIQEVAVDMGTLRPVKPWQGIPEPAEICLTVVWIALGYVLLSRQRIRQSSLGPQPN